MDEEELIEAVLSDPADRERVLVYSDLLQRRGDPRGELIAVLDALRGREDDDDLLAQRDGLERQLLPEGLTARWQAGFVVALKVDATVPGIARELERALRIPYLRTLTEVEVPEHDGGAYPQLFEALVAAPEPIALRRLDFGNRRVSIGRPLLGLARWFADLETLVLRSDAGLRLDQLKLTRLRSLAVATRESYARPFSLVRARLPGLEELLVDIRGSEPDRPAMIQILGGSLFPRLSRLGLWFRGYDVELANDVARRGDLPALRQLGIPVRSTGAFASILTQDPRFSGLELFDAP